MADQVAFSVDGRQMEADSGELLIEACEDNGVYIPRFCWHKRMKPVGMCRMCLVEVEGPRGVALVPSCTTRIAPDMVVHTASDTVKKAQEGVLEFLLINHPLDCPVCDRAGECPLQDQTMAYGPGESRFVEEKRHYTKPIPISDLVMLDRERCILCARCTRFSDEISGDPLIEFIDRGNGTQVLTFTDEPFASYFSGNTVEICPVGALTAVPYRFKARPWDLEAVESSCSDCSVGCRVSVQASQNEILRINGVDSDPVNHGWLCDKGRFAFEATTSEARLDAPLVRDHSGDLMIADWTTALDAAAERLGALGVGEIAGLGGARSTNEEAFAFGKFLRAVADTPHLDCQLGEGLDPQFVVGVTPRATIDDLDTAGAILLWGPDLKEELPVLYLRVRRAATELGIPLVVVHPRRTGLDDVAAHKLAYRPGEGLDVLASIAGGNGAIGELLAKGSVVALIGRTGLSEDQQLAESVGAFVRDLPEGKLMPLVRRSNTYGALDMGVAPTLLPGRTSVRSPEARAALEEHWGPIPERAGSGALGILEGLVAGTIKGLVLLGSDPVSDFGDPGLAARALGAAEVVIALDTFASPSVEMADVVFPVLGFAEVEGTVTNLEGRVQKVNQLIPGPGSSRAAWEVIEDLARRMGSSLGFTSAAGISAEIAAIAPAYSGISWERLSVGKDRVGVVVPAEEGSQPLVHIPVAGSATRAPDGLALHLARVLYDGGLRVGLSPSLARLAPTAAAYLNPTDAAKMKLDESMRVRASTNGTSADLPVRLDASLAQGTIYIPYQLADTVGLTATPTITIEAV
ncbi:MAG: NADH-quinone oxidoreductase subunit NuoG [Acidimicrobiia bacterium]